MFAFGISADKQPRLPLNDKGFTPLTFFEDHDLDETGGFAVGFLKNGNTYAVRRYTISSVEHHVVAIKDDEGMCGLRTFKSQDEIEGFLTRMAA